MNIGISISHSYLLASTIRIIVATVCVIVFGFVKAMKAGGQWGGETEHPNVFLCGSAAKRGGAVSGIPGHNAAMKVLEMTRWTS